MCAKGLHGLINKATTSGDIRGVSICQNRPKLAHLLSVDESLIFYRARESECQTLLDIIVKYERASGQQINRTKTTLFFSKSTTADRQTMIKDMIGVIVV